MDRKISYLERLFIDELNNEGNITIRGSDFYRDQILYQLDNTNYDNEFQEWKKARYKNNLLKADELLELHNNKSRFHTLRDLIKNQAIIPFIGAGLSYQTGLPLWKDFLEQAKDEINIDETIFSQHIDKYEYEEVAQYLEEISPALLEDQLQNAFGKKYKNDEIYGVICRLPEFFPNSTIITTNYDCLLKTIYEEDQKPFFDYLEGMNAIRFKQHLNQKERVLVKLHGSYMTGSNRVLTKKDYERHYNDNNSISSCIKSLFSHSVLFIGCSLNVDRTIQEMRNIVKQEGREYLAKHYAFLSCEDMTDEERKQRMEELSKANIFPIWYDGDHDECIEALLEKLNER